MIVDASPSLLYVERLKDQGSGRNCTVGAICHSIYLSHDYFIFFFINGGILFLFYFINYISFIATKKKQEWNECKTFM